jgi:hypothetical protein
MQFVVNKKSMIFDSLSVSGSLIARIVIKTEQLVFLQRDVTLFLLTLGCMQLSMEHLRTEFLYEWSNKQWRGKFI